MHVCLHANSCLRQACLLGALVHGVGEVADVLALHVENGVRFEVQILSR